MFFFIVYIILNFHRSFHDNCIGVLWLQFLQIYWSLSFCDLILSVVNLLFLFYLFVFLSCFPHIFKVVFGFWIQRYKILSYTFAFYLLLWRRAKLCVLTILSWSFKRLLCLLLCNRICELSTKLILIYFSSKFRVIVTSNLMIQTLSLRPSSSTYKANFYVVSSLAYWAMSSSTSPKSYTSSIISLYILPWTIILICWLILLFRWIC